MTSKTGSVIRVVLRAQRLAQKGATIDGVRRMSKITGRLFAIPKDVRREKICAGGITHEWLIPKTVSSSLILFHIHGGGFVFPLYDPERYTTAYLARLVGARAFLVNYRLAPENPFPAAVEDCAAAYRWLIREAHIGPEQVVFTGESAGGNLVITTLLALRESEDRLPAGAASICPVLDFEGKGTFYSQDDVMVHPEFAMRQFDAYRGGTDPHHPLLSPSYADLKGLPPILVQAGEHEILRSGAEIFAESARRSGVPVTLHIYPGMWHFWHMFVPLLPEAREAMDEISRFGLSCMR
jgi:monoterpene epsilon-lactone hydrolase